MPEYFRQKNIPVIIFNEGIGGSHTGYIADNSIHRIRHARDRFEDSVLAREPDVVTFNFGLNDSWVDSKDPEDPSRIPVNKYIENIRYMINELKKRNIHVILMTPNAYSDNYEHWRHERTEKYVKAVRKIAAREKLALIDQWKIMNEYQSEKDKKAKDFLLPDGMHTNDNWHEFLAEKLSSMIADLVK
jgi:lysophospholipase L1-like esterase